MRTDKTEKYCMTRLSLKTFGLVIHDIGATRIETKN